LASLSDDAAKPTWGGELLVRCVPRLWRSIQRRQAARNGEGLLAERAVQLLGDWWIALRGRGDGNEIRDLASPADWYGSQLWIAKDSAKADWLGHLARNVAEPGLGEQRLRGWIIRSHAALAVWNLIRISRVL